METNNQNQNEKPHQANSTGLQIMKRDHKDISTLSLLTKFHAGYFRISFALCGQALLWKTPRELSTNARVLQPFVHVLPSTAFILLWSLAFLSLLMLSLLYITRCLTRFESVRAEFRHHVGMNYLYAPWIAGLLLLQSAPFLGPHNASYIFLWWVLSLPIIALDIKIYGQWFTRGKKFLSMVANPTSHLSVIGNLVAARAAAEMGEKEAALCLFSLGVVHYVVLFVTLCQRFLGSDSLLVMLRPVFFLFFAAPSMARNILEDLDPSKSH